MGTGIGFGNGISVAEQYRLLMEFVQAADVLQELAVYERHPELSDPNALVSLKRLADTAAQSGKEHVAQLTRDKRLRLMQLQGGF